MKVVASLAVGVGVYFHKQIMSEIRFISAHWPELQKSFATQYNTLDDFLLFYHKERQQIPENIRKQLGDNVNIRITQPESDKNILR